MCSSAGQHEQIILLRTQSMLEPRMRRGPSCSFGPRRERAASMYAVQPYATAVALVELPYLLAQVLVFIPIFYFLIGELALSSYHSLRMQPLHCPAAQLLRPAGSVPCCMHARRGHQQGTTCHAAH